jgi:hypothetical protein
VHPNASLSIFCIYYTPPRPRKVKHRKKRSLGASVRFRDVFALRRLILTLLPLVLWFFFDGKRAVRIARVYGIIKRTIPEKGGSGHEKTTDFS